MKSSHTFGCTNKARGPRLAARDPAKEGNPMFLITAVDDSGGLLFNQRRQSQDRLLRARILDLTGDAPLWMDAYSAGLFEPPAANIRVAEDFLDQAGAGEYCLLEDREAAPYLDKSKDHPVPLEQGLPRGLFLRHRPERGVAENLLHGFSRLLP